MSFSSRKWTTWKNRSTDYIKHEYLYEYFNSNENMLFWRKTVWNPPFNEPPISKQFFHEHLFVQILKIRTPPNFRGEKLCKSCGHSVG